MDAPIHDLVNAACDVLGDDWCHNYPDGNDIDFTSLESSGAGIKIKRGGPGMLELSWLQNCYYDGEFLRVPRADGEVFPQLMVRDEVSPADLAESLEGFQAVLEPFHARLMDILHTRRRNDGLCPNCGDKLHGESECDVDDD